MVQMHDRESPDLGSARRICKDRKRIRVEDADETLVPDLLRCWEWPIGCVRPDASCQQQIKSTLGLPRIACVKTAIWDALTFNARPLK